MRCLPLAGLALFAFATSAAADEPKVAMKETFWQKVPSAAWVDFDADFNPVFHLETGYYFAKTGTFVKRGPDVPLIPTHIDRAGRIWVADSPKTVQVWTGTKWEKHDFAAFRIFDDSAGRVFVFDGKNVRVLDTDGKWTTQTVSKVAHAGEVAFVEQGKRVWFHGWSANPGYDGTRGVWSFTDGKWTNHTTDNEFPFHAVHRMYPMADGRIMLMEYRPPGHGVHPPYYWHPDRKLAPEETRVLPDKLTFGPRETALGTDGTLYLGVTLADNAVWMALDPKGTFHEIPNRNLQRAQLPHAVVRGQRVVFGKLGEPPPVLIGEGTFIGADRDGRHYLWHSFDGWKGFSRHTVINAVWPKHEQPGQILRAEKEKRPVRAIVKDDAGKIWAEPAYGSVLLQWHGGKWLDTPVMPLYHPHWTARNMSPWHEWTWNASHLFRAHGKNGSLLAVRIRDIYQIDEPQGEVGFDPPRPIRDPKFPHPAPPPGLPAGKERPRYWLEAFLFHNGKWTGPLTVQKLLTDHAAALLADFPIGSGEVSFFALANDGTRLWAAFDGKVLTTDKTGKIIEADWPREKPKQPLPFVMLGKLADGKVVLGGPSATDDGHTLALADGKIAAEKFPMPASPARTGTDSAVARWKFAKDGTLWYWVADAHGFGGRVWHFRAGKWDEKKGVGVPLFDDADGNVVCVAEPRPADKIHLVVVTGTETKDLLFPRDEWRLGFTAPPEGAHLWAHGGVLYCLDPTGGKPVLRWRAMTESVFGFAPVVVDAKGTALFGTFRGQLEK